MLNEKNKIFPGMYKIFEKLFSLKCHIMSIILELSTELFCSVLLQDIDL